MEHTRPGIIYSESQVGCYSQVISHIWFPFALWNLCQRVFCSRTQAVRSMD